MTRVLADALDEVEADFHQYYNLDIYLIERDKASRLLFQLPNESRTVIKSNPKAQWTVELELLRHILFSTQMTAWLNMSPKKGQESQWKKLEPKLFSPEYLDEQERPKEQEAMYIDELKEFLNRKRV